MAQSVFTATATDESKGDAFLDGYEQLLLKADQQGLPREGVTPFEYFGTTTDGRAAFRSYLHGTKVFDVYCAVVYVEGPVFAV